MKGAFVRLSPLVKEDVAASIEFAKRTFSPAFVPMFCKHSRLANHQPYLTGWNKFQGLGILDLTRPLWRQPIGIIHRTGRVVMNQDRVIFAPEFIQVRVCSEVLECTVFSTSKAPVFYFF